MPDPDLRDIRAEDLTDTGRALELHRQAVERGRITPSEADRVRFVAAVEHAKAVGRGNPCGLLARIVARGWWHLATQGDEDRASRRLREHGRPSAATVTSWRAYVAAAAGASPPPVPALRPSSAAGGPPRQPTALADLLARLVAGATS